MIGEATQVREAGGSQQAIDLAVQAEVPHLLGMCLIRLQIYETLLKAIVSESSFSVEIAPPQDTPVARAKGARAKAQRLPTLGQLIDEFLGESLSVMSEDIKDRPPKEKKADHRTGNWADFRVGMSFPEAEFSRIENGLRELVKMRNRLVHNFRNEHDLNTAEGCKSAQAALQESLHRIDLHLNDLRSWARILAHVRETFACQVQTDEFWEAILSDPPSA